MENLDIRLTFPRHVNYVDMRVVTTYLTKLCEACGCAAALNVEEVSFNQLMKAGLRCQSTLKQLSELKPST